MAEIESRRVAIFITQFFHEELNNENYSIEIMKHLLVATQCVKIAYDIGDQEITTENRLHGLTLHKLKTTKMANVDDLCQPHSRSTLEQAEEFKMKGNQLIQKNRFEEAIRSYSLAIELISDNPVYYGNRAAAYYKQNELSRAISDCETAIRINPEYCKAYARLGLCLSTLEEFSRAVTCYQRAVSLNPNNQNYKRNMFVVEKKWERQKHHQLLDENRNICLGNKLQNNRDACNGTGSRHIRRLRWQDEVEAENERLHGVVGMINCNESLPKSLETIPSDSYCTTQLISNDRKEPEKETKPRSHHVASICEHIRYIGVGADDPVPFNLIGERQTLRSILRR